MKLRHCGHIRSQIKKINDRLEKCPKTVEFENKRKYYKSLLWIYQEMYCKECKVYDKIFKRFRKK
jgi:hypothetical protein